MLCLKQLKPPATQREAITGSQNSLLGRWRITETNESGEEEEEGKSCGRSEDLLR
jgi:hypothetical protein